MIKFEEKRDLPKSAKQKNEIRFDQPKEAATPKKIIAKTTATKDRHSSEMDSKG
jgi:hypothetical protein